MRGVWLEVPESLLEHRRRCGHDGFDEMWEGVLHMVPPPTSGHQGLGMELAAVLVPLARARGLRSFYEAGLFRPGSDDDYRVPDQVYALPAVVTERGVEGGAALVLEIRSPNDETYEKLPWYGDVGVAEVLVVDPGTREAELYRGPRLERVEELHVHALDVRLATVEGPRLRITWDGGSAEV